MTNTDPLFVGLDIGTSSAKAVAFDLGGQVQGQASHSYELLNPSKDAAVQDPEAIRIAVDECLAELLEALPATVKAIGLSSAMHSIMAIDKGGKALSPLITWADGRAQPQADALRGTELGKRIYRLSGTPIHAMSPLCKLAWLQAEQPEVFASAARFVGIKDYIWYHRFGEWVIDHSLASATGLFDIDKMKWIPDALHYANVKAEQLPLLVTTEYKKQDNNHLAWVIGASDGCLANLGSGMTSSDQAVLTIGTSGAIRVNSPKPVYDQEERIFCYVLDADTYVVGGPTNNGGVIWEWFCRQFFPDKTMEVALAIAEAIAPGAEGLFFLPYLYGERAPVWDARAKGYFWDIEAHHTRAHFARAVLEGICLNLSLITEAVESATGTIGDIYANGGFTRSPFWVQLLSNVLGKRIAVQNTYHASAKGAAMLAMRACGYSIEGSEGPSGIKIYTPDKELYKLYRSQREYFRRIYPSARVS